MKNIKIFPWKSIFWWNCLIKSKFFGRFNRKSKFLGNCLKNRNSLEIYLEKSIFCDITLKNRNSSEICLENRNLLWNYMKKAKFFGNLPWKIDFFVKLPEKIEIFWKFRNFLTRVNDPQISNQFDAAEIQYTSQCYKDDSIMTNLSDLGWYCVIKFLRSRASLSDNATTLVHLGHRAFICSIQCLNSVLLILAMMVIGADTARTIDFNDVVQDFLKTTNSKKQLNYT